MKRTYANQLNELGAGTATISGWIVARRDHGKLLFIDIKDRTGVAQVVILPGSIDEETKKKMKLQTAITLTGEVQARPEHLINKDIVSGKVELNAKTVDYIAESIELPFELSADTTGINETTRLKYRYLDLRTDRMHNNIIMRHEIVRFFRQYLYDQDFIEIETPALTRSTPEGARDYLVPSRVAKGKFYALPQSPQQYKQLLMVSAFERYFQVVRCFRDEDQRSDRMPEFTQVDIEMTFIDQEDILTLVEKMVITMVEKLFPEKKLTLKPFPRLTFKQAMERYNTDKPDLRENKDDPNELAFTWVVDFPLFEYKTGDKRWGAAHHPFTAPNDKFVAELLKDEPDMESIIAQQYDLALNGSEVFGGSIRTTDPDILSRVFNLLGNDKAEVDEKFGHLLKAFAYGVPPHGGIAAGLDRLVAILLGEDSIREIVAFPKLGDGYDPLMDAPAGVSTQQLKDLGLNVVEHKRD